MVALLLATGTALGMGQSVRAAEPPPTKWRLDLLPIPTRMPAPVNRTLLDRYKDILRLSEAQRAEADRLFDEYRQACADLARTWTPALVEAAKPLVQRDEDMAFAREFSAFCHQRDAVEAALAKADEQLFLDIQAMLGESQLPLMSRVRLHRQRDRSTGLYIEIKESTIDLAALVEHCGLREEGWTSVDPILIEYELAATPLVVRRDEEFSKMAALVEAGARSRFRDDGVPLEPTDPADAARSASMQRQQDQLLQRRTDAQLDIVRVNRTYLDRLLQALPEDKAKLIHETYKSVAWSAVYPDPVDASNLWHRILKSDGITPEVRSVLDEQWSSYRKKYDDACARAMRLSEEIEHQRAWSRRTAGLREKRDEIAQLMAARALLNRKIIETASAIIPPDILAPHSASILRHSQRVENALSQGPPVP